MKRLTMDPRGPLDHLAMCCGLYRKDHRSGFDRTFLEHRSNYYSPSMAQMNAYGASGTWSMMPSFIAPGPFIQPQPQPYLLVTQPVILTTPQTQLVQSSNRETVVDRPPQDLSMLAPRLHQPIEKQSTIQATSDRYTLFSAGSPKHSTEQRSTTIYDDPAVMSAGQNRAQHQTKSPRSNRQVGATKHVKTLNTEIFQKLELIEKQSDLNYEMGLVEEQGIVITRAIDPYNLMPHLTPKMLHYYQTNFLVGENHVIRFIEIIKRPGQTLGLYIRTVMFESLDMRLTREGLVVTKIESTSPIYDSEVLHVGDEILSINLIDIQGMSLDDVVVLMSIPRRLVLALRIPKDRDQVFDPSRHSNYTMLPALVRTTNGSKYNNVVSNDDFAIQETRWAKVNSFEDTYSNLARPVRVHSAIHMNEILNEQKTELDDLDAKIRAMKQINMYTIKSRPESAHLVTDANYKGNNSSSEPVTDVLHYNLSIDQEIAHLEREAMNRDRPKPLIFNETSPLDKQNNRPDDILAPTSNLRDESCPISTSSDFDCSSSFMIKTAPYKQLSTTLPRRVLPRLPDKSSAFDSPEVKCSQAEHKVDLEFAQRNFVSNIRLGATSEQSNYFSTSIDAINRELKELRRQRIALDEEEKFNNRSAGITNVSKYQFNKTASDKF